MEIESRNTDGRKHGEDEEKADTDRRAEKGTREIKAAMESAVHFDMAV